MKLDKWMKKYKVRRVSISTVDLRQCYIQQTPNRDMSLFGGEFRVSSSPHAEICKLFFEKGEKWLKKNYKSTRYHELMKMIGKKKFPVRIVNTCKAMKKGYLRKGYKEDYMVFLSHTFAVSRYERSDVKDLSPEVFTGHHRAGALCALGKFKVKVVIAEDIDPGSCKTNGKIHIACVK